MDKDKLTVPFLVSLTGAIVVVLAFFLPYASAGDDSMAGSDYANVSMLKFLKKPVPIIVFNSLNLVVYYVFCWDFEDRGVVPNSAYDLGMAYYIYYISMAILMVGAIWMLVTKIKIKKSSITE